MSAVGLTKAQESGLKYIRGDHDRMPTERVFRALYEAGLCAPGGGQLTPRGHAALAAPRMTEAELRLLEAIADPNAVMHAARCVYNSCYLKGWIGLHGGFYALTDAGRKALNDIRAAMGSALYKENES